MDMGESFRRVDLRTTRATAHADHRRRRTGTTKFLVRTDYHETIEKEADAPVEQALAEAVAGQRAIKGERGGRTVSSQLCVRARYSLEFLREGCRW